MPDINQFEPRSGCRRVPGSEHKRYITSLMPSKRNIQRSWIGQCAHNPTPVKKHLYSSWLNMRQRCSNPKNTDYKYYGGRGISIDPRWNSFKNFFSDMHSGWDFGLSLNRKDNDGPYSSENCEWATAFQQSNNTRYNRPLTFNGITKNMTLWCRELGLSVVLVSQRMDCLGWSVDRALSVPARKMRGKFYAHDGYRLTLKQWAEKSGIPHNILCTRTSLLKWSISKAINTPHKKRNKRKQHESKP